MSNVHLLGVTKRICYHHKFILDSLKKMIKNALLKLTITFETDSRRIKCKQYQLGEYAFMYFIVLSLVQLYFLVVFIMVYHAFFLQICTGI